jgi:hypothetical protein
MRPMTIDQHVHWIRTRCLAGLGLRILRYGLAGLLLLWGSFKFAAFEAEAIRPLVENSPLLGWLSPPGKPTVSPDLDGVFVWVVTEANRDDMGLTICTDRGEAPETLARQIIDLRSRERAH